MEYIDNYENEDNYEDDYEDYGYGSEYDDKDYGSEVDLDITDSNNIFQQSIHDHKRIYIGHPLLKNCDQPDSNEQRFACSLSSFLMKSNIYEIDDYNVLNNILNPISKIKNIEDKNIKAYVLGYYVIKNNKINKNLLDSTTVDDILKLYPNEINKNDIIRYARFLINIKNNL